MVDPIGYIFDHRVQSAKVRGKEWTITRENFRDWCNWTGYHLKTGRTRDAASIDRKDPAHGYHVWNIASIPYGANSAKGTKGAGVWEQRPDGSYGWNLDAVIPF